MAKYNKSRDKGSLAQRAYEHGLRTFDVLGTIRQKYNVGEYYDITYKDNYISNASPKHGKIMEFYKSGFYVIDPNNIYHRTFISYKEILTGDVVLNKKNSLIEKLFNHKGENINE